MKQMITLIILEEHKACDKWVSRFHLSFPHGVEIDPTSIDDIIMLADLGFGPVLSYLNDNQEYNHDPGQYQICFDGQTRSDFALVNCDLAHSSLRNVKFSEALFQYTNFYWADLTGATFEKCNMRGATCKYAKMDEVKFIECEFSRNRFVLASMDRAEFAGVSLDNCQFEECKMAGIKLAGISMTNALFKHCNMDGADLNGAKLNGSMFHGTNLRGADLRGADLSLANLEYADLTDADLTDAIFYMTRMPDGYRS